MMAHVRFAWTLLPPEPRDQEQGLEGADLTLPQCLELR